MPKDKYAEQMKLINAHSKAMRQDPPKPAPKKPSTAENFKTLGAGMARSTKRMIDQKKIIADPKKK